MKIVHKLFLSFLLFVLLIWFVGYIAIDKGQEALKTQIGKTSASLATEIIKTTDKDIFDKIVLFQEYSKDMTLQRVVSESNREFEKLNNIQAYISQKDQEWTSGSKEIITPFIQKIMSNQLSEALMGKARFYEEKQGHKAFGEIFVTNKFGANVAMTGETTDYRQNDEQWWQKAKRDGVSVSDIAYDESAKIYSVDIAIRIEDKNGSFMGIIKVVVNIAELIDILDNAEKRSGYDTVKLHMIDKKGKAIYSKKYEFLENMFDHLSLNKIVSDQGRFEGKGTDGNKGISLYSYAVSKGFEGYGGLGWILLVECQAEEIFAPVNSLRNSILIISLGVTIFAIIICFFISLSISKPITRLKNAARAIGKGELDTEIEVRSNDEIGQLAGSFKRMVNDLKKTTTSIDFLNKEIAERKQAEEKIKAALKEKEILLQEIHHRVKNNMQIISSLLKLQASSVGDERVTDALMECKGRVQTMAFVHETLYSSDSLAVIDFMAYISKLANQIFQSYGTSKDRVKLEVDAEDINLGIEQASPLGLIANELVTNSLKYAFPENRSGEIVIRIRAVEQDIIEFVFSDSGIGMPEGLDWRNTDSLGLRLVIILADQLDGTVSLDREKGTHFTVRFRHEENQ